MGNLGLAVELWWPYPMTERLTLCLIVKDEAAMLPGFLASVSGLWDELIAVDTVFLAVTKVAVLFMERSVPSAVESR